MKKITSFKTAAIGPPTNSAECIQIDKFFHSNLFHQCRAISTPSLVNDKILPRRLQVSISHNTLLPCCHSQSKTVPHTDTLAIQNNNVGLLNKLKRTLVNFNRFSSSFSNADLLLNNSTVNKALLPKTVTEKYINNAHIGNRQQNIDTSVNMDIMRTSVCRSSQERRRNKYNRQDKCNSGDSGIQIEIENFFGQQNLHQQRNLTQNTSKTFLLKQEKKTKCVCSIRRSNSAKLFNFGYDIKDKKRTKKCSNCNESEQMVARPSVTIGKSISQPYGLDSYGLHSNYLRNGCSIDCISIDSQTHNTGNRKAVVHGKALCDFKKTCSQELSLIRGNVIEILYKDTGPWWFGCIKEKKTPNDKSTKSDDGFKRHMGWFPKSYVCIVNPPDTDNSCPQQQQYIDVACEKLSKEHNIQHEGTKIVHLATIPPNNSAIALDAPASTNNSNNQKIVGSSYIATPPISILSTLNSSKNISYDVDFLEYNAIKELLETEINYVKHLAAICDGYLPVMKERADIFPAHSLNVIFSNITTIYKFHKKFLDALYKGIQQKQLARVFLKMQKGFLCYSIYCNSYPRAIIELESYEKSQTARTIFNKCQEATKLQELPLSAHLLAPIQRICRYPLHLTEIIKTMYPKTEALSTDIKYHDVINGNEELSDCSYSDNNKILQMALETMKNITETINESKRHSESIERYQQSFQNFKGAPLNLHSIRFFLQIDATRQKQNLWNSSCTLFLFDNQIIYCKRDILKRTQFIYKGRIHLDRCRIFNVKDGKIFSHMIKNSLRIYCDIRDKWFDFSFRSANKKQRFLNTLALERQFSGKTLHVAEMSDYQYAFRDAELSDQSDYDELSNGSNRTMVLKKDAKTRRLSQSISNTSLHFDDDSSISDSLSKFYVAYNDAATTEAERLTATATMKPSNRNKVLDQARPFGRRRLGKWFRRSKSSSSTPNQSPTHKPNTIIVHSTGDLEMTSTFCLIETHNDLDNGKSNLIDNRSETY